MSPEQIQELLLLVKRGECDVNTAMEKLRRLPYESTEHGTIDHHRALRCGHAEVIFCPGKTVQQVLGIATKLSASGQRVLATRASDQQLDAIELQFSSVVTNRMARAAIFNETQAPVEYDSKKPYVAVVSAGTADMPMAEEAAFTLRFMQIPTLKINDVGVAGLHRILARVEEIQKACAVVCVAGMEGALPSVVGGLVRVPVFAVPTSIGYGVSFGGLAALLGMLNSCASTVSVVNIDNGFGAGYCAGKVYQQVIAALNQK